MKSGHLLAVWTLGWASLCASASPTLTTLVSFNGYNGLNPTGGLVTDAAGNLYGVTAEGGTSYNPDPSVQDYGVGTVFMVSAGTHQLTTLASFSNGTASQYGDTPQARPVLDGNGSLYGSADVDGPGRRGTIFKVNIASHTLTTVFAFNGTNGANPNVGLVAAGPSIYCAAGIAGPFGNGVLISIDKQTGAANQVLAFNRATNVGGPYQSAMTADAAGSIYGIGVGNQTLSAFRFDPSTTTVDQLGQTSSGIHQTELTVASNGIAYYTTVNQVLAIDMATKSTSVVATVGPVTTDIESGVLIDAAGNIFGTANKGGAHNKGFIYEIDSATRNMTDLIDFDGTNGSGAQGTLVADSDGTIYGTSGGTVFELTNSGFIVPEPSSLACFGVFGLVLGRRRSRQAERYSGRKDSHGKNQ